MKRRTQTAAPARTRTFPKGFFGILCKVLQIHYNAQEEHEGAESMRCKQVHTDRLLSTVATSRVKKAQKAADVSIVAVRRVCAQSSTAARSARLRYRHIASGDRDGHLKKKPHKTQAYPEGNGPRCTPAGRTLDCAFNLQARVPKCTKYGCEVYMLPALGPKLRLANCPAD
jgi:hypothetical protein